MPTSRAVPAALTHRGLVGPADSRVRALGLRAASHAVDDELYAQRIVRLYAVLIAYGLIALAIDVLQAPYQHWGGRVHWPRLIAVGLLAPLAIAGARGWASVRALRASEPLVYLVVVAEVSAEVILSAAPMFSVDQPAIVILFLRACFIPSRPRHQAAVGALVTVALGAGAFAYMRLVGRDLTPFLAATGNVHGEAIQLASVAVGGAVFTGITTYATHTIRKLRVEAHDARQMGQYVLEHRIGQGGMGEVWRARHALLQRPTAVKLIRGDVSESLVLRFEREVRAAAQMTHANTVAIYDFGVADGGRVFYAMELLDGLTLEGMVERGGPMPAERVLHLLAQVLGALEEAHLAGVVHRDVKPANVMVVKNGAEHDFPKLLDYGIVHLRRHDQDLALTGRGALTGTPLYMAPEMISGETEPDGRTDLYALGAVAYYLLTGAAPFTGPSAATVLIGHLTKPPVPPSQRSEIAVPADVEAIVLKALEKDPERRFATAGEMRAALRACACFGGWTEERAAEWWGAYAPQLGRRT